MVWTTVPLPHVSRRREYSLIRVRIGVRVNLCLHLFRPRHQLQTL